MLKLVPTAFAILLSSGGATYAQETCPNPLPEQSTPDQLIACVVELQRELDALTQQPQPELVAIPSGAILAFDLSPTMPAECPDGWRSHRELRGRMIVGAGEHTNRDETGAEISSVVIGTTGGEENHTLELIELPAHSHTGSTSGTSGQGNTSNAAQLGAGYQSPSFSIDTRNAVGSAQHPIQPHSHDVSINGSPGLDGRPHNNMPPFLALLYCIRE